MSSDDQWQEESAEDPFAQDAAHADFPDATVAPKKGMGTGMKVFLALAGVGGICLLLCCGVGAWLSTKVDMEMIQNPADTAALQTEIVTIDVPASFAAEGGMKMDFLAFMTMKMAVYRHREGAGTLLLMEMNVPSAPDADMEREMRKQIAKQGFSTGERKLRVTKSESRDFEIRGQTVPFRFEEAKDASTQEDFRQVTGIFRGNSGFVMIVLQVDAEHYDEDEAVQMVESIE